MNIKLIETFKLSQKEMQQLSILLHSCFDLDEFKQRTYFKQLPHYRLILKDKNQIVGQIGLDYRVMTLNQEAIKVLGIIDFAILPTHQGKGLGKLLLEALEHEIKEQHNNIDFILLAADNPTIYLKFGYKKTIQTVKWLAIDEHKNYGIQTKLIDDCLMYKKIGTKTWKENGELDMLGYFY